MTEQTDLLQDELARQEKGLLYAFGWWEKKRILYNIVIFVTGIVTLYFTELFRLLPTGDLVVGIILWGLLANLAYCLGFFTEIAFKHYLKSSLDFTKGRQILFWLGVFISVLLTMAIPFWSAFAIALSAMD
jgi:hypothetical protein